jgi:hypothetical protein
VQTSFSYRFLNPDIHNQRGGEPSALKKQGKRSCGELPWGGNAPAGVSGKSRGSGNAPGQDEGLGAPGKAFADRFTALVGKNRVKVSYNPYEAVGILPALQQVLSFLTAQPGISRKVNAVRNALNGVGALARQPRIGAYHDSVLDGESKLRTTIEDEQASCKNTKLLLVGYSQGAQVSADVYQQLSASKRQNVFGVVLFGDPRYSRSSFADQPSTSQNYPVAKHRPLKAIGQSTKMAARPPCLSGWVQISCPPNGRVAAATTALLGCKEQCWC